MPITPRIGFASPPKKDTRARKPRSAGCILWAKARRTTAAKRCVGIDWRRRKTAPTDSAIWDFFIFGAWGVKKDKDQAARWHQLAAAQGQAQSQYSLGWMRARGDGLRKTMFWR